MLLTESFCGFTNQSPYFFYTGLSENWYRYLVHGFDIQIQYNGNYFEWMAQEVYRLAAWKKISELTKIMMISSLEKASLEDTNSYETLCFGLLVKAIKNG